MLLYDHHSWMEGGFSDIQVLIPTEMPSAQPIKNSCLSLFCHWGPRDGQWMKQRSPHLPSGTWDIRLGLQLTEKPEVMYFLCPLQLVLSTLPLKEIGCFSECSSQNLSCSLQWMRGVLCPPSIKLKPSLILHKVYPLYHTFPRRQTAIKVAFICETQWPQKSVSQMTVPLILKLHNHFSSLWFSQNSSSYFIFFRTRIWKKSDKQSQLLKYIHVGSTASEEDLGWEIICLLKSEISP